jgi:hypothetical protein
MKVFKLPQSVNNQQASWIDEKAKTLTQWVRGVDEHPLPTKSSLVQGVPQLIAVELGDHNNLMSRSN